MKRSSERCGRQLAAIPYRTGRPSSTQTVPRRRSAGRRRAMRVIEQTPASAAPAGLTAMFRPKIDPPHLTGCPEPWAPGRWGPIPVFDGADPVGIRLLARLIRICIDGGPTGARVIGSVPDWREPDRQRMRWGRAVRNDVRCPLPPRRVLRQRRHSGSGRSRSAPAIRRRQCDHASTAHNARLCPGVVGDETLTRCHRARVESPRPSRSVRMRFSRLRIREDCAHVGLRHGRHQ